MFIKPSIQSILLSLAILAAGLSFATAETTTSASTTVDPFLNTHLTGVDIISILTVDDGTVPKTGGGTTQMVGFPDGIGVIDGTKLTPPDPDHFYLLLNHELATGQGVSRDHGNAGAFVSKWKIDKVTKEVVEGDDLIKQVYTWDENNRPSSSGQSALIWRPVFSMPRITAWS